MIDIENCMKQNILLKATNTDPPSSTGNLSFTVDVNEPIKDVVSIKHVKTHIELVSVPTTLDMLYIKINDYDLLHTYNLIKDDDKKKGNLTTRSFVGVPITDSKFLELINDGYSHLLGDPQAYKPNPVINHLKSFKVEIYKSDGTQYQFGEINKVFIELCVFSSHKKITQA